MYIIKPNFSATLLFYAIIANLPKPEKEKKKYIKKFGGY